MRDLIGRTLGHYRIVEKIGEGGMGVVYRAHDERLDRDVAIKVLHEVVAQDADRLARFEREAKAVAKLAHPNILEIWDFGREDGVTYAVTELLDGQNLRQCIPASGMPWQKVAEMGATIADGIAAAHGKGIVHRDLKPENVFVTSDGRVKILDFGLAQVKVPVEEEAETATLTPAGTVAGTVLGTLGYMSPEQLKGEASDARSDIFAFGCVLYEMLSGRSAFLRKSTAETSAAILKEEPSSLSDSGTIFPVELERTVRRCLEKSPEARFQSASDLAYNLRAISTAPTPMATGDVPRAGDRRKVIAWTATGFVIVVAVVLAVILSGVLQREPAATQAEISLNRVAVVPMENRTGDPSLDELGVMAADLIVRRFTETGAVEAVPMADALQNPPSAGPDRDQRRGWAHVLERARQRGAGLVLAGAYYLDGEILRLQARLVDAATGDLIYAFEPVIVAREAAAEGIDSLRERVVAAVAAHVNMNDIDIAVMRPPSTYDAYQAYQRGMESFGADWPEALAHLRRALELDPEFHLARFGAVWVLINLYDDEGVAHGLSALEERLDRMTPYEKAYVRYQRSVWEWDRSVSVDATRRLLELCPKDQGWRLDLGMRALELNRPREAVDILDPVQNHDFYGRETLGWWSFALMTAAHHMLGDYQRELGHANLGLERFPGLAHLFHAKARALAATGRTVAVNEIIDEFLRIQTRGGSAGWLMSTIAMELRAHGYREAADDMAARAVKWYEGHPSALQETRPSLVIELWSLGDPAENRAFASALCMVGRWQDAEDLIVQLIDNEPSGHQLAGWLGVIAAIRGETDRATQVSGGLPAGESPRAQGWGTYWQASIAAHLGEEEMAVELLAEAFSKGYPYGVSLHSTMNFEPLWDYPPFQDLIEPKG